MGAHVQTKLKSNNKNTIALFKVNQYTISLEERLILLNPILVHYKHIYYEYITAKVKLEPLFENRDQRDLSTIPEQFKG